jgi:hypothetical protein
MSEPHIEIPPYIASATILSGATGIYELVFLAQAQMGGNSLPPGPGWSGIVLALLMGGFGYYKEWLGARSRIEKMADMRGTIADLRDTIDQLRDDLEQSRANNHQRANEYNGLLLRQEAEIRELRGELRRVRNTYADALNEHASEIEDIAGKLRPPMRIDSPKVDESNGHERHDDEIVDHG